jgi:transcriptional regulator with XRE-family HTH domain
MRTTQSAISELEKGNTDPRISTLQRYARAVGAHIDLTLIETKPDGETRWRPLSHLRLWRTRALPYNRVLIPVRVEKDPNKIYGTKLEITSDKRWRPPAHTRNPFVSKISISAGPDEYLRSVSRG